MMVHPNIVNVLSGISGVRKTHNLVEALRSTKACRASANDEDVDLPVI